MIVFFFLHFSCHGFSDASDPHADKLSQGYGFKGLFTKWNCKCRGCRKYTVRNQDIAGDAYFKGASAWRRGVGSSESDRSQPCRWYEPDGVWIMSLSGLLTSSTEESWADPGTAKWQQDRDDPGLSRRFIYSNWSDVCKMTRARVQDSIWETLTGEYKNAGKQLGITKRKARCSGRLGVTPMVNTLVLDC